MQQLGEHPCFCPSLCLPVQLLGMPYGLMLICRPSSCGEVMVREMFTKLALPCAEAPLCANAAAANQDKTNTFGGGAAAAVHCACVTRHGAADSATASNSSDSTRWFMVATLNGFRRDWGTFSDLLGKKFV